MKDTRWKFADPSSPNVLTAHSVAARRFSAFRSHSGSGQCFTDRGVLGTSFLVIVFIPLLSGSWMKFGSHPGLPTGRRSLLVEIANPFPQRRRPTPVPPMDASRIISQRTTLSGANRGLVDCSGSIRFLGNCTVSWSWISIP